MKIVAVDIETTNRGGSTHGPHPMHPDNEIVLIGTDVMGTVALYAEAGDLYELTPKEDIVIVGHNLAFDIKYLMRYDPSFAANFIYNDGVVIWDTLVAEYVLNGQDTKLSLTLEDTCARHRIPFTKDPDIVKAFKAGHGADTIEKGKLAMYLEKDVKCLAPLADHQIQILNAQGMMDVAIMRMKARKQLILAEYHGMKIDTGVIMEIMPEIQAEMAVLEADLKIPAFIAPVLHLELTKPLQLATYLYGGTIKYDETVADGLYKNGKIKYKKVNKAVAYEAKWLPLPEDSENRSVDEETLKGIRAAALNPAIHAIIDKVLRYRELSKEHGTYCVSLLKHCIIGPSGHTFIHANINCTATATGRLSSSKPNLQNIKNGRLKRAFVSRYGKEGRLIEIDFAQLEIIALATLCRDTRLIHDILDGVDIHTALYQDMYHTLPTKAERKAFKPRTFALVYGASHKGIALAAKISMSEALRFKSTFYNRYSGVYNWHRHLASEPVGKSVKTAEGYRFQHTSPTGLRLTYYCQKGDFSPTQLVNYPVQSFAADLVQLMVWLVGEYLARNFPTALLVNVVHDSIIIDAQAHEAEHVARCVKEILEDTPTYMKEYLNVDMSPIDKMEVGVTIGENWYEMKELT